MKLNPEKKEILAYGAGAGLAVVIPFALVKFVDKPTYPSIWQKPSVAVPLVTGIAGIVISQYTKLIKNKNLKKTVMLYGITSVIIGILQGFAGMGITAARLGLNDCSSCASHAQYQNLRNAGGHTNMPGDRSYVPSNMSPDYWTDQYYPNFQGTFLSRPQSRAQGWGSDVTRNPMAAIPTTHPSNEIRA